jgi:predicted nucleic acid-binding protein
LRNSTLPIPSICFIDANIIFYIVQLKSKDDFLTIIEQVYESVYIHEEVYNELSSAGQQFVDEKCHANEWVLFKPLQAFKDTHEDYMLMLSKVQSTLIEIDTRRDKAGSAGTGEIAS